MPSVGPTELGSITFWPTPFFVGQWAEHGHHAQPLIEHLYSLRDLQAKNIDSGVAPGAKAARGIYESHFDLFQDPHPAVQTLVAYIRQTLALAVCRVNGNEVDPKEITIEFPDSWYHITNDGGFHDAHVHSGCSWCGIYYVRIGTSGPNPGGGAPNGGTRFYSPISSGGAHKDYGNKYLQATVNPPMTDGMLLLFPSYLMHSGLPYQGPIDRVVIAFNSRAFLTETGARRIGKPG